MAKAKTLRAQYDAILAKDGKRPEDFKVYGWRFATDNTAHLFSYGVKSEKVSYGILDAATKNTIVLALPSSFDALSRIAARFGGEVFFPIID